MCAQIFSIITKSMMTGPRMIPWYLLRVKYHDNDNGICLVVNILQPLVFVNLHIYAGIAT